MKTKVCDKCGEEKPLTEFGHKNQILMVITMSVNLVGQDI